MKWRLVDKTISRRAIDRQIGKGNLSCFLRDTDKLISQFHTAQHLIRPCLRRSQRPSKPPTFHICSPILSANYLSTVDQLLFLRDCHSYKQCAAWRRGPKIVSGSDHFQKSAPALGAIQLFKILKSLFKCSNNYLE